jgi:hypothetical protein
MTHKMHARMHQGCPAIPGVIGAYFRATRPQVSGIMKYIVWHGRGELGAHVRLHKLESVLSVLPVRYKMLGQKNGPGQGTYTILLFVLSSCLHALLNKICLTYWPDWSEIEPGRETNTILLSMLPSCLCALLIIKCSTYWPGWSEN